MKIFKHYLLLSLITLSFFTSCKDDDDDTQMTITVSEDKILGSWNLVDFKTLNAKTVISAAGQTNEVAFSQTGKDFNYSVEITSSPNIISGKGSYTIDTTSSILGEESTESSIIDSDDFDSDLLSGSWELINEGTTIKITSSLNTSNAKIIEFSDSKLVLSIDLSEGSFGSASDFSDSDDLGDLGGLLEGFSTKVTGNTILTFTK